MTIFVTKGDAPLTASQLEKRSQANICLSWGGQAREQSIRKGDGLFDKFMTAFSTDHLVNIENNAFNYQLKDYTQAVARLAQYVLAEGRVEVTEMQPTGEQVFNEETMEMDDVLAEVITQSAIEPLEPTVEVTTYSDDIEATPTVTTVTNPLIVTDEEERASAQAIVDATPIEVKTYEG